MCLIPLSTTLMHWTPTDWSSWRWPWAFRIRWNWHLSFRVRSTFSSQMAWKEAVGKRMCCLQAWKDLPTELLIRTLCVRESSRAVRSSPLVPLETKLSLKWLRGIHKDQDNQRNMEEQRGTQLKRVLMIGKRRSIPLDRMARGKHIPSSHKWFHLQKRSISFLKATKDPR